MTRRGLGRSTGMGAIAAGLVALGKTPDAEAKKKRLRGEHNIRGDKAIICFEGETVRIPKRKRKKWIKRGAARGACRDCVPVCTPGSCDTVDGCGGTCACAAGSICVQGVCQACTVACDSTPAQCGKDLSQALAKGGDIFVCPGRYGGPFGVKTAVRIYGAGGGADAATNTILDGQKTDATVTVGEKVAAAFTRLRIVNGDNLNEKAGGGGIFAAEGSQVTVSDCVIDSNTAVSGGGVYFRGTLEMIATQVTNNTSYPGSGGGITGSSAASDTSVLRNCLISGNSGAVDGSGSGGGLFIDVKNMSIEGTEISGNTGNKVGGIHVESLVTSPKVTFDAASKVTGNSATGKVTAGGLARSGFSTVVLNGTTITGNTDPQCAGETCS